MPKIIRSMREEIGKPAIGPRDLGVRVPPESVIDISVNDAGFVNPGMGGMSVSPSLFDLPARLVPKRLRPIFPGAAGSNALWIWSMGTGEFADGPLANDLRLRLDGARIGHGFVEPDRAMHTSGYILAIENTRDLWVLEEV